MKCELIFYLAGRTGQLEELLEELLGGLGVIIAEVTAATSPEELAAALEKGVSPVSYTHLLTPSGYFYSALRFPESERKPQRSKK